MSTSILAGALLIRTRLHTGVFSVTAPTTLLRSRGHSKNPGPRRLLHSSSIPLPPCSGCLPGYRLPFAPRRWCRRRAHLLVHGFFLVGIVACHWVFLVGGGSGATFVVEGMLVAVVGRSIRPSSSC